MIEKEVKDRVRLKTDLVELIEELTDSNMVVSGNTRKTYCPFPDHEERTPSFVVYPDDSRYYCFGCGLNGDSIDFIREYMGMTFVESVQYLGKRLDIEVVDKWDTNSKKQSAPIADINAAARDYFVSQESETVTQFLVDRNLDPEKMRDEWEVGFSRAGGLIPTLKEQGFSTDEMIEAGVVGKSDQGRVYEVFRDRMMWTIYDQLNRVAGFGARKILDSDTHPAKFINTSGTELYKKQELLFGLNKARQSIRRDKIAILCEGYTDVVVWHEAGLPYSVASCGTSITHHHIQKLARLVSEQGEIVVAMDGDAAGVKSMWNVLGIITEYDIRVTGLLLPEGQDPEDYRREHGDQALYDLWNKRKPLTELLIENIISQYDQNEPEQVAQTTTDIGSLLSTIKNPVLRDQYENWTARRINITTQQMSGVAKSKEKRTSTPRYEDKDTYPEYELNILRMAYQRPEIFYPYRDEICSHLEYFSNSHIKNAVAELVWIDSDDQSEWKDEMLSVVQEPLHFPMKTGLPMMESNRLTDQYMSQLVERLRVDYEDMIVEQEDNRTYSSASELLSSLSA